MGGLGGPSPLCGGATPWVCKKAGRANHEKQPTKLHSPVASTRRFLPGVPSPTSLDGGLQTMRRNKPFLPRLLLVWCFISGTETLTETALFEISLLEPCVLVPFLIAMTRYSRK